MSALIKHSFCYCKILVTPFSHLYLLLLAARQSSQLTSGIVTRVSVCIKTFIAEMFSVLYSCLYVFLVVDVVDTLEAQQCPAFRCHGDT